MTLLTYKQGPNGNKVTIIVGTERIQNGKAIGTLHIRDTQRALSPDTQAIRCVCDLYEVRAAIDEAITKLERKEESR